MTQANKKGWEFLLVGVLIASTLVFGCSPMQKTRVYRIGVLLSGDIRLEAFSGLKDGLRELGYVEGEPPLRANSLHTGRYELEVATRRVPATIHLRPLYDPENRRVRS